LHIHACACIDHKQSELCNLGRLIDHAEQGKLPASHEPTNATQLHVFLPIVQLEHRSRMWMLCMCPICAQQRLLSSQASNKGKRDLERVPGTASAPALQWPEHPLPCWDCCHPSFCGAGQCQCSGAHPSCPPHSPAPAIHVWHVLHTGPIKSSVKANGFPQSVGCQTRRFTPDTNQTVCIQYLPGTQLDLFTMLFGIHCHLHMQGVFARLLPCICNTVCIAPMCIFRPTNLAHRHVDLCRMVRLCRQSPMRTPR